MKLNLFSWNKQDITLLKIIAIISCIYILFLVVLLFSASKQNCSKCIKELSLHSVYEVDGKIYKIIEIGEK